jgi:hypothetical protein
METANVDIRKLQLLNDRINQTIEALHQVRLSVHGLQHTAPVTQNLPWGYQQNLPVGQIPMQNIPVNPMGYGIGHTGIGHTGIGHTGVNDPRFIDPRLLGLIPDPRLQDPRFVGTMPMMGGLSHTERVDPFWRERLFQTFPYATVPYPVVF